MELSQVLVLYLVILISIISIILLIVLNRTNLRIRFLYEQIKGLKTHSEINSVPENIKQIEDEVFLSHTEKLEIKLHQRIKKTSAFKEKLKKLGSLIEDKTLGLEKFTGENILDKLGIIVFLAGIAFFVSISMDFEKIDAIGRIFFTILIAAVMLLTAFFIRNKFRTYSSVLIGGGVSTLIFTVFAAFYQYQIMGLIFSFVLLFTLIGLSVFLSLLFKRSEITIIVFIAGFIAPFTVSFDTNDYIVLFSYILIINLGVIVYDYFKKSLVINVVSYIFTFLFFALWLIREIIRGKDVPQFWAFVFLTVFYIMIFIIIVINNIRENKKFIPIEFTSLVFGTGMYYTAGLIIIDYTDVSYKGLFTALIAVINFIWVLVLYKRKDYDRNLLHLFIGISLIFITLVVPVEMVGKSVTLVWAIQACALLWISQKADLPVMKLTSVGLTLGMLVSLSMNFYQTYISTTNALEVITPVFNKGFLTGLVAIASLTMSIILLKNEKKPYISLPFLKINLYKGILGIAALVTLYYSFRFEIQYGALQKNNSDIYIDVLLGIYNFAFMTVLAIPSLIKRKIKSLHFISTFIGLVAIIIYVIYYNSVIIELRNTHLLSVDVSISQFNTHYFIIILLISLLIISFKSMLSLKLEKKSITVLSALIFVFGMMYMFSSELDNIITVNTYSPNVLIQEILLHTHRLPYTLLWGVSSLLLILIGFLLKNKEIRTVALMLYIISLIKLFVFDFVYLSNEDLMVAFMVLGPILLIISFVFQLFYNSKYFEKFELNLK
jgi:hypothetical protein